MKKKIFLALLSFSYPLLQGCYPGWQTVKIEPSVVNQPCVLQGKMEVCKSVDSNCEIWFKKRATKVDANTISIETYDEVSFGRYYNCQPGFPPYKKLRFSKEDYTQGSNTVTGQAFLRQRGGGVVTCAGNTVIMYPNNLYFLAKRNGSPEVEINDESSFMEKSTQCDATGNFEFSNIQNGEWVIETTVGWDVPEIIRIGYYYSIHTNRQGGLMRKEITVRSNEKNRFIISNTSE
ncbi:hypothetical protein [Methyloprofundus sedimenti]|nr:hypothetical protein [Methyloprofundus sedimenti]